MDGAGIQAEVERIEKAKSGVYGELVERVLESDDIDEVKAIALVALSRLGGG